MVRNRRTACRQESFDHYAHPTERRSLLHDNTVLLLTKGRAESAGGVMGRGSNGAVNGVEKEDFGETVAGGVKLDLCLEDEEMGRIHNDEGDKNLIYLHTQ